MKRLIVMVAAVILIAGCSASRQAQQLKAHQVALRQTAQGTLPTEEKIDILATSFVRLMNEGVSIVNPKKGLQYIQSYGDQNVEYIDSILEEVSEWQAGLDTIEKIAFVARLTQKPYTRELFDLLPKFEQRYRQVKFVMDLTNKMKSGLKNLGLKALGL